MYTIPTDFYLAETPHLSIPLRAHNPYNPYPKYTTHMAGLFFTIGLRAFYIGPVGCRDYIARYTPTMLSSHDSISRMWCQGPHRISQPPPFGAFYLHMHCIHPGHSLPTRTRPHTARARYTHNLRTLFCSYPHSTIHYGTKSSVLLFVPSFICSQYTTNKSRLFVAAVFSCILFGGFLGTRDRAVVPQSGILVHNVVEHLSTDARFSVGQDFLL